MFAQQQLLLQSAAAAACSVCSQQLPGTVKLVQVLGGSILQHIRQVAQPARQMEPALEPPTQIDIDSSSSSSSRRQEQQPLRSPASSSSLPKIITTTASPGKGQVDAAAAAVQRLSLHVPQQQQQHGTAVSVSTQTAPAPQPPSPTGVKKTFYKRKLPCPPATEFSSAEGRLLFAEALQQGTMSGFFKLIEQYSTQDEPAFCGLASIAMVLNALSIDPKRPWKGSWRWFHEELLDCCLPLSKVAQEGVVLTQAACLAKCNGANVTLHRSGTFSLEAFRQAVIDTCSSDEEHLVVSYTRKAFGQTGDGHFSPIGGYHSGRDLVLILDTARFKYPPHWVPLPMLYEAMSAVDPTTGQPRGYLRLSANARPDSVLFTLDIRPDGSWRQAEAFIQSTAPELVQAAAASGQATPEALLRQLVALAPLGSVPSFIAMRFAAQSCARDRCVPHTVRQQVLRELRATPLHQAIQPLLAQHLAQQPPSQPHVEHSFLSEKLTVLLLLQEPAAWGAAELWSDPQQHQAWKHLLDASAVSILDGEVGYLRQQLRHIEDVLQIAGTSDSTAGGCNSCSASPLVHAAGAAVSGLQSGCGATAAAGAVLGAEQLREEGGDAANLMAASSPCSTCIFHDDCSLKGCVNVHGEVEVQQGVAGAATAVGVQHQHQQQHMEAHSSSGCCSSGHGQQDELLEQHGCCS